MSEMTRTYQTRISAHFDAPLADYASLSSRIERCLFADCSRGKKLKDLKSSYLIRFGITARQFNAIRVELEGKIDSIRKRSAQQIELKKQQIKSLEGKLPKIKSKKIKHQKNRRLELLRARLQDLETNQARTSLCFGSRKLFAAQFHLQKNGYATHEEWKLDWQAARSSEIFMLGSKDESHGNQSCTPTLAEDGSIAFRVRMPDALIPKHGKYVLIPNIRFAHGHETIVSAIQNCQLRKDLALLKDPRHKESGQAITFRFKKDKKGWRIFLSTELKAPPSVTRKENGVMGLDINGNHLALVEIDRFGNAIEKHTFPLALQNTTKDQARALIGDVSKQIIELCEQTQKPLVLEDLDFQKKKTQLRQKHKTYARMLSAFAYQSILTHLKSRGRSKGIQVHSVNPAYTSVIGRVNYAKRYGLSIHHAAALCIGRRFLGVSERMPQGQREIPDGKGGHVTLDLPVRNRSRHVWVQWGQLNKKLPAALTAHFRAVNNRSSSSCKAALETFPDLVGEIPTRESPAPLFC